ncbi:response regulator transcription factor [Virgibacillus sp. W0430]|uniref:response regulator transcription factor n=1 Tax=Virgibacillus sp. W0430 TaxID=3391580 RepID=UPI003F465E0B
MDKETILVVEDEVGIRDIIQMYLRKKGYEVMVAQDGRQAIEKIRIKNPQLILLDIEMPGIDGFEVCREIRKKLTVPIIFLSVRRTTLDKVKSFELGADDYLTKPFEFEELEARIKANIRRYRSDVLGGSNILKFDELEINLNNYMCYLDGEQVTLSTKEMELLILLAKNPNQVWSQEQLYDHIWKLDATGNVQTVKVHISNLRKKLEKDQANPKFIKTVRGFGYLFAQ